ncbi:hypothetical protein BHM03_00045545 [Ensete ventricosum]|nr:hypothetical protein BHM03_00045545 [Ensete ventricosum]
MQGCVKGVERRQLYAASSEDGRRSPPLRASAKGADVPEKFLPSFTINHHERQTDANRTKLAALGRRRSAISITSTGRLDHGGQSAEQRRGSVLQQEVAKPLSLDFLITVTLKDNK